MKYVEGKGGWCTRACNRAHGCGLWRSISEGWDIFAKHFSFVVGEVLAFFFGMISRLGMFLLKLFILSYFCVQLIRRFVFLMC